MEMDELNWLRLTAHQKLVFNISKNVRCVFMALANKELTFIAYFDKEPDDEDRQLLSDAACETAMDFPDLVSSYKSQCIYEEKKFLDIVKNKNYYYLYARSDPD